MPFLDRIKKAYNETKSEVKKAYSSVVDNTKEIGNSIYDGAKDNLHAIADGVSDIGTSIYNGAKDNLHTVVDGVVDAGNSVFSGAKETVNTAANGLRQLSDVENLGDAVDVVTNTGKEIVQTQKQTGKNVSKAVKDTRDQVTETTVSTYQNVSQTVKDSRQQVVDNTNNTISDVVQDGREVKSQIKQSKENISTTVTDTAEYVQETVSTKITETVNQVKELKEEYADPYIELTKETFGGTDGIWDGAKKQNYLAGQIMSEIFLGNASYDSIMQKIKDVNESYELLRENKESGYQNIPSELPEDEQREAREYALGLIRDRLQNNKDNMPEYGDVSRYYNEGSLVDWMVSHPVSFAADAVLGEEYNEFSHGVMGKDGIFTPLNIPTYIANRNNDENDVRQDYAVDMLGNFRSTVNINKDIENKEQLIAEMEANIDNPERFAELYYQVTDGMNFSADRVHEHKQQSEKGEKTKPLETIIGRDYITEDIAKNELGTDVLKKVNKAAGTGLLKGFLGGIGVGIAAVGNAAIEVLDAATDGDELTTEEAGAIIVTEVANTIAPSIGESVAQNVCPNMPEKVSKIVKPFIKKGSSMTVKKSGSITGDIIQN